MVRLRTLVTPDIAFPEIIADPPKSANATHRSFWVEVMTGASTRDYFKFHAVGRDITGSLVDFTAALMFVSVSDIGDSKTLKIVAKTYNDPSNISRRSIPIP